MDKENIYKITGSVQGVFFRAEAKKIAEELGIKGYVKNEPDGGLTIVAQGDDNSIEKLEEWCRKGPPRAQVEDIQKKIQPAKNQYQDFEIIY